MDYLAVGDGDIADRPAGPDPCIAQQAGHEAASGVSIAAGSPEPQALEHAALRWVGGADVPGLDWVAADRAVAADLVALLRDGSAPAFGTDHGRGP